ncbi:MAG: hypothetical protein MRZ94_08420 [Oscillospiraceae bacterium]|nr:hypothetical protein [Oscillospiraceae bacterium]
MKVKDFEFKRDFLKHTNFKNGYHVYTGMETVSDKSGEELPESVIKLLYRIYAESVNNEETEV